MSSESELYIRELRCKKQYRLATELGKELLNVYPNSNIIREEMAISYYWIDGKENIENMYVGNRLLNEIEESRHGDVDLMNRVQSNKKFFMQVLDKHEESRPFKPYDVSLFTIPLVTFSITTCKRLDLFIKTMTGFLENCMDRHLIHRWICVDDNSSDEDRQVMKEMFPFFEFTWKTSEEKGHPKSMQIITSMVKTPYLLHMEDDWMLLDKRHYIKDMIDIFNHDKSIGQVAFNHNYVETMNKDIRGGDLQKTSNGVFYYVHEYCPTVEDKRRFFKKHGPCASCNYYPHFTLSPSMVRTFVFDKVTFNKEKSFEFNFGLRYVASGFKTVFLPGFHIKHIGRLSSESNDIDKYNAYDLNDEEQFREKTRYKSFFINLDRRPDRLEHIEKQRANLPVDMERLSAYDGTKLVVNPRLRALCRRRGDNRGDYFMRPDVIGRALSHLNLYDRLLHHESDNVDGYVIFEDDVIAGENFLKLMRRTFTITESGDRPDLIFFTTTAPMFNHRFSVKGVVRKRSLEEIEVDSVGGLGCYYISKKGAKAVLDYIEEHTLDVAIDTVLFRLAPKVAIFFVQPPIISQYNANLASDIQNDFYLQPPLYENVTSEDDYDECIIYNSEGKMNLFENLAWSGGETI
jgi:GR25 family glycosyltransferase involved in LPS biosynthesis/GT2 family glycosyltransferase